MNRPGVCSQGSRAEGGFRLITVVQHTKDAHFTQAFKAVPIVQPNALADNLGFFGGDCYACT